MADRYVWSGATGAGNGTSWADAYTTLLSVAAVDTAGDTIHVASDHSESLAGPMTLNWAGTSASPVKIISENRTTGVAEFGAFLKTTGAYNITLAQNAAVCVSGLSVRAGDTASTSSRMTVGSNVTAFYENCLFAQGSTAASFSSIYLQSGSIANLRNCDVSFTATTSAISVEASRVQWDGGTISGGVTPSALFSVGATGSTFYAENWDLSGAGAAMNIVGAVAGASLFELSNSRLPAGWAGVLCGAVPASSRIVMRNCDNADTNYRLWIEAGSGGIRDETTIVRAGGASDGTTPISWRMSTNANASEFVAPLASDPIYQWNDTTGTGKTLTVEILHDSVTPLTNAEVYVEVCYLGNAGYPLGSTVADGRDSVLVVATNQDSSSATWTTTGLSNPNKQKLSATFTPQEKGLVSAVVRLAKPSTTIYVCPMAEIA